MENISLFVSIIDVYADVQSWRKAVSNAKVQYEYQNNRLMNLELLDVHGGSLWLHHNQATEGMQKQVDSPSLSSVLVCLCACWLHHVHMSWP